MKKAVFNLIFVLACTQLFGQIFATKTGEISFYSVAQSEANEAHNYQVFSVLNTKTGEMGFDLLISGFSFQNKLMQKHFNENYIESDKYPKAKFVGRIKDMSIIKFNKPGTYVVVIAGKIQLRNITKEVATSAKIEVTANGINGSSSFSLKLNDFDIKIPVIMEKRVSQIVKIDVVMNWLQKK